MEATRRNKGEKVTYTPRYKAIVIGESKAIDGSKNYTVKVKIPDERDKEVTLPSEDLKPLKWYDF